MPAHSIVTIARPWHWGIAILSDPSLGGRIPDVVAGATVSANDDGIIVLVRHAQDGIDSFADDVVWSDATVSLRLWEEAPPGQLDSTVLFEGRLQTPTGRLSVGDADGDAEVEAFAPLTWVRVLAPAGDDSPSDVTIDLWQG